VGKTYLFWDGLNEVAKEVRGDEKIFVGVRPFGFHAGNELTMYVYPWHLCDLTRKNGKEPRFNFFISINDMEPHRLKYLFIGEDGKPFYKNEELTLSADVPFEYNVFPRTTSFQFTDDSNGCCDSIVTHWQKIIEEKMMRLKADFPEITLNFIRNTSLKNNPAFKKAITTAIKNPEVLGKILEKYDKVCFEKGFLVWTGVICPHCHSAQGKTSMNAESVIFECDNCGKKTESTVEDSSFWMHHVFLLPPRLKIFDVDICVRGYDHYRVNQIPINEQLFEALFGKKLEVKTIVPPMIVGPDGKKMSKTWSNEKYINTEKLKELSKGNSTDKIVIR